MKHSNQNGPQSPGDGLPRKHGRGRSRARWAFNPRPLVIAAVLVALAVPAAYWGHRQQMKRHAATLLTRAETFEQQEEWPAAAEYLHRYLQMQPVDFDVRARLARSFDQAAASSTQKSRAIEFYALAIAQAPAEASSTAPKVDDQGVLELRRRQAELSYEIGDFRGAEALAAELLASQSGDPAALRVRALARFAQYRVGGAAAGTVPLADVVQSVAAAHAAQPGNVLLAAVMIELGVNDLPKLRPEQRAAIQRAVAEVVGDEENRTLDDVFQAEAVLDELVRANPDDPKAWLLRYEHRSQADPTAASDDLDRAIALHKADQPAKDGLNLWLAAARRAEQSEDFDEAGRYYELALAADPVDLTAPYEAGHYYYHRGDVQEAIRVWRDGLARVNRARASFNPEQARVVADIELKLTAALLQDGRVEEASANLDEVERQLGASTWALPTPARLRLRGGLQTLRAQILIAERDFPAAAAELQMALDSQRPLPGFERDQPFEAQMLVMLGNCFAAMLQWDRAAEAYDEATVRDPSLTIAWLSAGRALESVGRMDAAVERYARAAALSSDAPTVSLALAEATFRQQIALPEDDRDGDAIAAAVADAVRIAPDSLAVKFMQVQWAALDDRNDEALRLLAELEPAALESAEFVEQVISAYERLGAADQADAALARLAARDGDSARVVLLRAGLLARRNQLAEAEQVLRSGLMSAPVGQRAAIELALAQALFLQRDSVRRDEALAILARLADEQPDNVALAIMLADLARAANDMAQLRKWEEALRRQEGPAGTYWRYYRAERLIAEQANPDAAAIREATELAGAIQRARPHWSAGNMLRGRLAELGDRPDEAIEAYRAAIDGGERRLAAYQRLVGLLHQQNRIAEAHQVLDRLGSMTRQVGELSLLRISLDAVEGNRDQAIQRARESIDAMPNDAARYLVLGQLLSLTDLTSGSAVTDAATSDWREAEAAFRKAQDLAPTDGRAWAGLLSFYVRTRQLDAARAELTQLTDHTDLPPITRAMVAAQGYELLNDSSQAEKHYREAIRVAPDDVGVRRRAAAFLAGRDPALAEESLRRLVELEPENQAARRDLIMFLAARGGEARLTEASALLDALLEGRQPDAVERRLKVMLAVEGGQAEDRQAARELLEQAGEEGAAADAADQSILARLYEMDDRPRDARNLHQQLIASADEASRAPYLAAYMEFLLRQQDFAEAENAWKQLAALRPDEFKTISLRAGWLYESSTSEERRERIASEVDAFGQRRAAELEDDLAKAALFQAIAALYESLEYVDLAEGYYRRLPGLAPDGERRLAAWLLSRGGVDAAADATEALEICLRAAASDDSPKLAVVMAQALIAARPSAEERAAAEAFLERSLELHADRADVSFTVATLRLLQGRPREAIDLLRKTLTIDDRHVMAMNNLAMLVSEEPHGAAEALTLLERALEIGGRDAELLDTQGMVLLRSGQSEAAKEAFQEAADIQPGDARYWFHLALAWDRLGDGEQARQAFATVQRVGLREELLTADERVLLEVLIRSLGASS